MAVEFRFEFPLPLGLHARPASFIQEKCQDFQGEVIWENQRTFKKADAKSAISLLTTDTQHGDVCRLVVSGADEKNFAADLESFLLKELPLKEERALKVEPAAVAIIPGVLHGSQEMYLVGQPASSGVVSGKVLVWKKQPGLSEFEELKGQKTDNPEEEIELFRRALESVRKEIEKELTGKSGPEKSILKAHRSLASDPGLSRRVEELIVKEKLSATAALIRAVSEFSQELLHSKTQYIRERIADLNDIALRLLEKFGCQLEAGKQPEVSEPAVLVAEDLLPSDFLSFGPGQILGLVLEKAGQTSHTLIMARGRGVPAVTGVAEACRLLSRGEEVVVDGHRGVIIVSPGDAVRKYYKRESEAEAMLKKIREERASLPGATVDGKRIEIAANIGHPEELKKAWEDGAEAVGIFRTELLLYGKPSLPSEDEQFILYKRVAEEAGGRPVIIRTFDIGGDKPIPCVKLPKEPNPFLGYRGIRIYREYYELFRSQVRAILRAARHGKLRLMFPMVALVEEVRWLREQVKKFEQELEGEGIPFNPGVETGIMLEIPSVAMLADKFAPEVDFFSVGSNDLLQYFFAADRGNPLVKHFSQPLSPALLRLLKLAIDKAHEHGKWVGLCGELAGDSRLTPVFVGLGFDELSMSSGFIPEVKWVLSHIRAEECQGLVAQALESSTSEENEKLLEDYYQRQFSPELITPDLVMLEADCGSKVEVMQELAIAFERTGRVGNRAVFEQALWKREQDVATEIGFGLAIPHCQSGAVRAPSIGLMRLKKPIDWQSREGQPVDLIICLAIPSGDKVRPKLQLLPKLSRKLIHEEFRDSLRQAKTEEEIVSLILSATTN
ncbi:MAG: phosphoenolpyruvate--protein phosphotransferase [Candidatus Saccharicenans sp.]|nr:phosphoenolpyruvate--protein phosphotransferase [Candidatus Saccharicenans sp.]